MLVLALAVRLWTVDWGLPYIYDPDEPVVLSATIHMLKRGDLNPHWFHYPSLVFYLHGGILAVGAWIASGFNFSCFTDSLTYPEMTAMRSALLDPEWMLLLPRLVTSMLSTATAALVYSIVLRISRRRLAAVFAGLLIALVPLVVREARQFAPDTIAMFATAGVIWGSLRRKHQELSDRGCNGRSRGRLEVQRRPIGCDGRCSALSQGRSISRFPQPQTADVGLYQCSRVSADHSLRNP